MCDDAACLCPPDELEVERMRLAACGVAARGGSVEKMRAEYDSDSLRAVLELRERAERDALLARLGAAVLLEWHNRGDRGDVDGGWLQDEAEKIGVVLAEPKTGPCSEDCCPCAEYHGQGPWTCYPIADGLLERAEVLSGNAP